MFDFEKFTVYLKTEKIYQTLYLNVFKINFEISLKDQLKRASSSILLNIAEWSWKFTKNDKRNFYVIARWSVFECVAILRILKIQDIVNEKLYDELYYDLLEVAKMLSGLIRQREKERQKQSCS